MLRIGIVDDDCQFRSQLQYLIEVRYPFQFSVEHYANGRALLHDVENGIIKLNILLLDIKMPWVDGIQAAARLRSLHMDTMIILVTQYKDFVFDGYDVGAYHYLLKPLSRSRFYEVFDKALAAMEKELHTANLTVTVKNQIRYIPIGSVLYIESFGRKTMLHTVDGMELETYKRISEYERELNNQNYFRAHKSFLINLRHLVYVDTAKNMAYLSGNDVRVPVSRNYIRRLLTLMFERVNDDGATGL